MEGIVAEVALFGAAQIGLLLVVLGRMWSTQKAHGQAIVEVKRELSRLWDANFKLATKVAKLEAEVKA